MAWQRNGMAAAWERHAMYESALSVRIVFRHKYFTLQQ